MRHKLFGTAILISLLASGAAGAPAQGFPWELYEPRTLREVVQEHTPDVMKYKETGQIVFTMGRPYRVPVIYTGDSRPMSPAMKGYLEKWIDTYSVDPKFKKIYETEYLFIEDGVEYWLPVQTPVSKHFSKELTKGDKVDIYVQFVGGIREKNFDKAAWLFLVNEFQKHTVTEGVSPR